MFYNPKLVLSLLIAVPSAFAALNGACTNHEGICISTTTCGNFGGSNVTGKCPDDPNDVKCCFNIPCNSNGKSGSCMFKSKCTGTTVSGLCPGGSDFLCCLDDVPSTNNGNTNNKRINLTINSGYNDPAERELVRKCQRRLISLRYNCGSSGADGYFGNNTKQCVIQFQRRNRLNPNGVINNVTYRKLFSITAKPNTGSGNSGNNSGNSGNNSGNSGNNSGNSSSASGDYLMTASEFVNKVKDVESTTRGKNTYVQGSFGFPMNDRNKNYFLNEYQNSYNSQHQICISKASADTFAFDCVNLIKAVLWGWTGDLNDNYGGAKYVSSMDVNADGMIGLCDASTDFSNIVPGEVVWLEGHIGVYIGDGEVIESTPRWSTDPDGCGQIHISKLENIGASGEKSRTWDLHGKLPFIKY